ncbi:conserved exported hypothetical protein [Gammaproteobacteria bacterium]
MKNIKLEIFTILALVLLQIPVFGEAFAASPASSDPQTVIDAIKIMDADIVNAISGNAPNSIVNTLNTILVGTANGSSGNVTQQGTRDKQIDLYAQKFYGFYTNQDHINKMLEIGNDKGISDDISSGDLLAIGKNVENGTSNLLKQEVYYDTQKTLLDRVKDILSLLIVKAEGDKNNIDSSASLSISDPNSTISKFVEGGTKYGSVNDSEMVTNNSSSDIKEILNANVLIGPDSYFGDSADQAKLFINQLMQASPPPKTFYFPSPPTKQNVKKDQITVYYPYRNAQSNTPYTESQGISTSKPSNCNCTDCGCLPAGKPCSCDSDYERMLKMVSGNQLYQQYKIKTRSRIALRTFFLSNVFRAFQERYKKNQKDQSLVEKEKSMALVGLTPTYYSNLKTMTVAEVNLETLHTLNKVVYFLYRLHQDNAFALLIASVNGLQNQPLDIQDESTYLVPIGNLIDNACWDRSDKAVVSPRVTSDAKAKRFESNPAGVCVNPAGGTPPSTGGSS